MGPAVQLAVGVVIGVTILAIGAVFAGRAEEAIYAAAALASAAFGVMLLADLMIVPGLIQAPGNSLSPVSLLVTAMQVGGISLALFALVLILMGGFTGLVWAARRRRPADLVVPCGAVVALVAGVAFTAASIFGRTPLASGAQTKAMALAGFGLGTLAAALIAFWAMALARQGARSRRATASVPPV